MTAPRLDLAVRDWDFITPLLLGDVRSPTLDLRLHRVNALVDGLARHPDYDGGEMSLSRFTQSCLRGERELVGVPQFIMRAFRHRCIITRRDSPLHSLAALAGQRIGMTGWQDSGNTWTRALLRREGIGTEDARWFVGRLAVDHPVIDRLNGFGRPGRIEALPGEVPLVDALLAGDLDAVFTPFMPPGFFAPDAALRPLLPDVRGAELAYFNDTGYVPGIHLIGLKPEVVGGIPGVVEEVTRLIDESTRVWLAKRAKYADTTPWILEEIGHTARDLPASWSRSGWQANRAMLDDFCLELHAQGLTPERGHAGLLFD